MCTYETTYFYSPRQRIALSKKIDPDKLINQAIDQLHDKAKVKNRTDKKLFERTYEPLKAAVKEGYGVKVEFGTPNYEFLKQLQYNVATFAAFKNHAQIKEMASLLIDDQGKRRTKEEFKKKALEVDEKYNTRYLDIEYDTAVRQARSAAQWQKALTTKHLFPNIKYLPSVSANKREVHIKYYNIIRPMDDPIWSRILPVNEWGCKCGWEVTDEAVTDIPDDMPPPGKGFEFNPGKTGEIFKLDSTEYAKAVPNATKEQLIKNAKKVVDYEMAAELPYINVYSSKAGTDVVAHPLAFDNSDFQTALTNARKLANAKEVKVKKIEILPELNKEDQVEIREKLLPGTKINPATGNDTNPDYRIDGKYIELKEVIADKINPVRTIGDKISHAHTQAEGIVLVVHNPGVITEDNLYRNINGRLGGTAAQKYKGFDLYLFYNGKWSSFNQTSWQKFYTLYKKKKQ